MKTGIPCILCLAFVFTVIFYCPSRATSSKFILKEKFSANNPITGFYSHTREMLPDAQAFSPDTNIVLPVRWVSFTAVNTEHGVDLCWVTLHEQLTHSFVIERSQDGKKYNKIGEISAAHTSYADKRYNFSDLNPKAGLNFYRIMQVDKNDAHSYSEVRKVNNSRLPGQVTLIGNPVNGENIVVDLPEEQEQTQLVCIYNSEGKLVLKKHLPAGLNNLDIQNLHPGLYFLRTRQNIIRFVKK